ncbi:MAG: hypothetical protein IPI83_15800 [Sphingomonadales bacterium]|nr:hypothetical protein [Sphingomonadales bacterium]
MRSLAFRDNFQFGADAAASSIVVLGRGGGAPAPPPPPAAALIPRFRALAGSAWRGAAPGGHWRDKERFKQNSSNYAFFTHNVIDIIPDKLSLTLGGRYTHERKTDAFSSNNNLPRSAAPLSARLPDLARAETR